jgi:bacterioferritin-associated ferredoxin
MQRTDDGTAQIVRRAISMIICSCNVLSVQDIRIAMTTAAPPRRISELFRHLGCRAQCGCCARSVRQAMDEPNVAAPRPRPGRDPQGSW